MNLYKISVIVDANNSKYIMSTYKINTLIIIFIILQLHFIILNNLLLVKLMINIVLKYSIQVHTFVISSQIQLLVQKDFTTISTRNQTENI